MTIGCVIKFDENPYGIYYAGQSISGTVQITFGNPKKVRGICLNISGFSKCKWSEYTKTGKYNQHRNVYFEGREDYLSTKMYFVGSDEGNQLLLPAGLHVYNFSFPLPLNIPTSFEGKYGHVRYTACVALERPWKFDQTYKVAFTVVKPLDLNLDFHTLSIPSQLEVTDSFGCGWCKSGPFSMVATIQQSGYVPGQEINVRTQVTNKSGVAIQEMRFVLLKLVTYHGKTPYDKMKTEIIQIQEKRTGGVMKAEYGSYNISLLIPAVPPTNINLSKIIHINYEIKIEAVTSSIHHNQHVRLPITVGTIPLKKSSSKNDSSVESIGKKEELKPVTATAPNIDGSSPVPIAGTSTNSSNAIIPPNYPNMLPPSYEESMFGNRQIEDEEDQHPIGHQMYTPRYPVFRFHTIIEEEDDDEDQVNTVSVGNDNPGFSNSEKF